MSSEPIKKATPQLASAEAAPSQKIQYDFLFDFEYYKSNVPGLPLSQAVLHYKDTGSKSGLAPNPFSHPSVLRHMYGDAAPDNLMIVEFGEQSPTPMLFGPLLNLKYFCWKNNCDSKDAIYLFLKRLREDTWCDFSPLVCEEDFQMSGATRLYDWVAELFDPNRSLVGRNLIFFLPDFYRKTASKLTYQNELIDYLLFSNFSGGWPHPLCDLTYSSINGYMPPIPYEFGDAWSDHLASYPSSVPLSPFFDSLEYRHRMGSHPDIHDAATAIKYFTINPIKTELNHQIIHNCLRYAAGKCDVTEFAKPMLGSELIQIMADFMTSSSEAPAEIKTSVCILNYNKVGHTFFSAVAAALNSDEHTEVLVFDNGSAAWQSEILLNLFQKHRKIRYIRSRRNLFFGEGNNVAKDMAHGEYLHFLNNDAYVGPGTIRRLVAHLDERPEAAGCGVPFLFPDGSVQEYGGAVTGSGQQIQDYKHTSLEDHLQYAPELGVIQTEYVSSACFCVRRKILQEIGGYDYIFEPLYFEDTDLCKRINSAGYDIDLLPDNYVIHVENATTREFLGHGFDAQITRNRDIFQTRWQYKPRLYRPRSLAKYQPAFVNVYPERPTAYVYTPYGVSIGGGERYLLSIVSLLSETHSVTLFTQWYLSRDRLAFVMSDLGLSLGKTSAIRLKHQDDLMGAPQPDLMVVMGNELVPPFRLFGKTNIYHCQFPFPSHGEDRYQFDRLDSIDFFVVNSDFTRANVERKLDIVHKTARVEIVPPPVTINKAPPKDFSTLASAPMLISVGRFENTGHSKNQHIIAQVFDRIYASCEDAALVLVGGYNGSAHQSAYINSIRDISEHIKLATNAPRSQLEDYLKRAHIYVHACGYGASLAAQPENQEHFGISVVEAMSYGCIPIVYNAGGPKTIVDDASCGFTYSTIDECAAIIRKLMAMPLDEVEVLSAKAMAAAWQYADDKFADKFRSLLKAEETVTAPVFEPQTLPA